MATSHIQLTQNILDAVIGYKQKNDGISASLAELATQFGISKSQAQEHINHLVAGKLLGKTPGNSRNLSVNGGRWQWLEPRPYPTRRAGDVLKEIVAYKQAYDGNAPSHREIAQALALSYTGDIKAYMDDLADEGYLTLEYATDRHICVAGGRWDYDENLFAQANLNFYKQRPLLSLDWTNMVKVQEGGELLQQPPWTYDAIMMGPAHEFLWRGLGGMSEWSMAEAQTIIASAVWRAVRLDG